MHHSRLVSSRADYASSSLIISKSSGRKIYRELSLCRCSWLNGSASSEADIIVHAARLFQSKSETVPMCPMWFRMILSSQWHPVCSLLPILSSFGGLWFSNDPKLKQFVNGGPLPRYWSWELFNFDLAFESGSLWVLEVLYSS